MPQREAPVVHHWSRCPVFCSLRSAVADVAWTPAARTGHSLALAGQAKGPLRGPTGKLALRCGCENRHASDNADQHPTKRLLSVRAVGEMKDSKATNSALQSAALVPGAGPEPACQHPLKAKTAEMAPPSSKSKGFPEKSCEVMSPTRSPGMNMCKTKTAGPLTFDCPADEDLSCSTHDSETTEEHSGFPWRWRLRPGGQRGHNVGANRHSFAGPHVLSAGPRPIADGPLQPVRGLGEEAPMPVAQH